MFAKRNALAEFTLSFKALETNVKSSTQTIQHSFTENIPKSGRPHETQEIERKHSEQTRDRLSFTKPRTPWGLGTTFLCRRGTFHQKSDLKTTNLKNNGNQRLDNIMNTALWVIITELTNIERKRDRDGMVTNNVTINAWRFARPRFWGSAVSTIFKSGSLMLLIRFQATQSSFMFCVEEVLKLEKRIYCWKFCQLCS